MRVICNKHGCDNRAMDHKSSEDHVVGGIRHEHYECLVCGNQVDLQQDMGEETLEDLLLREAPDAMRKWDVWDYRIWPPLSLADKATFDVHLKNEGGVLQELKFTLHLVKEKQ